MSADGPDRTSGPPPGRARKPAGGEASRTGAPGARSPLDELRRARVGRLVKVGVALLIAVLLIVFILSNAQPVVVDFVFFDRRPRLIWVMLACGVLGGAAGYLIGKPAKGDERRRDRKSR